MALRGKRRNASLIAKALALGAFALMAFIAVGVWDLLQKERHAKESAEEMQQRLAELEDRRAVLGAKLEALETQRGIENEIRETYQVAKEGERMAVIVDRTATTGAAEVPQKGFWAAMLGWFGF